MLLQQRALRQVTLLVLKVGPRPRLRCGELMRVFRTPKFRLSGVAFRPMSTRLPLRPVVHIPLLVPSAWFLVTMALKLMQFVLLVTPTLAPMYRCLAPPLSKNRPQLW